MDDDLFGMDDSSTDTQTDAQISFHGIFTKAWTSPDGGWNVTFSLSEQDSNQVLQIASLKDRLLAVGIVPVIDNG